MTNKTFKLSNKREPAAIKDILLSDVFLVHVAVHILQMDEITRNAEIEILEQSLETNSDDKEEFILHIVRVMSMNPNDFENYFTGKLITPTELAMYFLYWRLQTTWKNSDFINLYAAQIKDSSIHGKGVFAKNNIQKGEVITMYPYHVIIYSDDSYKFAEGIRPVSYEKFAKYIYQNSCGEQFAGLPHICDDPTYIGHMINDGSNSRRESEYYANTKINCTFFDVLDPIGSCMGTAVVATRDISADEELFLQYGYQYWYP